ncbi:hypothetical protein [Pleionea sp. CnH1-48]|uniref:hypothetical protein n=1 Tax=Pleionea sp. CnH1-48 TaxID=2954494 RepID=UPI0020973738|nr:hypothetical protein [Pleionea sp. CnH1-48]MCO7223636.1 hypothetical protein [Pleionea sp. CnH1-48]
MNKKTLIALGLTGAMTAPAFAVPFEYVRIGDQDGFGFNADANFAALTGDGGLIDRNNDGQLGPGDVLPSLNGGGVVATGSGDDFDNRLNESVNGIGFSDNGTQGVEFTDIALSTSYDNSSNNNNVYDANTSTWGSGGTFPSGNSNSLPNQPGFVFDFFVSAGDIVAGTDIFFNMVFGDYDVFPAEIDLIYANNTADTLPVNLQNNGPDDGLIQAAFVQLSFADVFTWDAINNGWSGYLEVNFDAPNEPYTAFDFVELSVAPITVPEPGPLSVLLLGLGWLYRARKNA